MHTTIVRSWSATAVGVFFTLITGAVLLEDVYHGAPINSKHIMTAAVLLGTIFFGHAVWRELRSIRLGNALGCAVLFLAGTCTCVIMSAGRNAEVVLTKALNATNANTDRKQAQLDFNEAKARYLSALNAETLECNSGSGGRCKAKRETTRVLRVDLNVAETKLVGQKPEQIANADLKAAAGLLTKLPYVTVDETTMESLLQLFFPFSQSLFCEIAAICGFSIGFGHAPARRRPDELPQIPMRTMEDAVIVPPVAAPASVSMVSPELETVMAADSVFPEPAQPTPEYIKAKKQKPTDVQLVLTALERAGRPVSNDELATILVCSKGESSKRLANCGNAVVIRKVKRSYAITPNYAMQV
jgi:hypothetical protein